MKNANGFTVDFESAAQNLLFTTMSLAAYEEALKQLGELPVRSSYNEEGFDVSWFYPIDDARVVLCVYFSTDVVTWEIRQHEGEGENLADESCISIEGLWGDCVTPTVDQMQTVFQRIGKAIGNDFRRVITTLEKEYNDRLEIQARSLGTTRSEIDEQLKKML